eukprot:COSAG02_NODE_1043_length_15014_cov_8.766007_5_plen_103_part_00
MWRQVHLVIEDSLPPFTTSLSGTPVPPVSRSNPGVFLTDVCRFMVANVHCHRSACKPPPPLMRPPLPRLVASSFDKKLVPMINTIIVVNFHKTNKPESRVRY